MTYPNIQLLIDNVWRDGRCCLSRYSTVALSRSFVI